MSKIKVLLIDDNESDLALLKRFLKRLPSFEFEVMQAKNSEDAVTINQKFDAEIAFVDYFLGNETGIEIIKLIKSTFDSLDCILLTGHGDDSIVSEAFKIGATDYISKTELSIELIERSMRYVLDKRKKRKELERLEKQLLHSQKMKSLGVMAGGIAHDFNNLFTVILGQLNLLEHKVTDLDNVSMNISGILSATERATKLSNQMLAFSGKGTFLLKEYSSNNISKKLKTLLKTRLPDTVELEWNDMDDECHLEIDFTQIKTAVFCIIENSVESMSNKGKITINCYLKETKNKENYEFEHFYELKSGLYYVIEIIDTGHGVPEELKEKIFEPFFTTKFQGRGLGLSESLGILKSHKGTLKLSENIKETVFELYLPAKCTKKIKPKKNVATTENTKNSILIIDDEKAVLEVSKEILEYAGYNVITAINGETGISAYIDMQEKIKAILIDMTMPGISGLETMEKIKKINKDAYVILTSGYSKDDALSDVNTIVPSDFLQKPFSPKSLIDTFQSLSQMQ